MASIQPDQSNAFETRLFINGEVLDALLVDFVQLSDRWSSLSKLRATLGSPATILLTIRSLRLISVWQRKRM